MNVILAPLNYYIFFVKLIKNYNNSVTTRQSVEWSLSKYIQKILHKVNITLVLKGCFSQNVEVLTRRSGVRKCTKEVSFESFAVIVR